MKMRESRRERREEMKRWKRMQGNEEEGGREGGST